MAIQMDSFNVNENILQNIWKNKKESASSL